MQAVYEPTKPKKKRDMCIRFGRILYYPFVLKYAILDGILI